MTRVIYSIRLIVRAEWTAYLSLPGVLPAVLLAVLLEQLESTLLGLVALAGQELQSLLASSHLLSANNAPVLVLDQVLLGQTTGSVLCRTVENLRL